MPSRQSDCSTIWRRCWFFAVSLIAILRVVELFSFVVGLRDVDFILKSSAHSIGSFLLRNTDFVDLSGVGLNNYDSRRSAIGGVALGGRIWNDIDEVETRFEVRTNRVLSYSDRIAWLYRKFLKSTLAIAVAEHLYGGLPNA